MFSLCQICPWCLPYKQEPSPGSYQEYFIITVISVRAGAHAGIFWEWPWSCTLWKSGMGSISSLEDLLPLKMYPLKSAQYLPSPSAFSQTVWAGGGQTGRRTRYSQTPKECGAPWPCWGCCGETHGESNSDVITTDQFFVCFVFLIQCCRNHPPCPLPRLQSCHPCFTLRAGGLHVSLHTADCPIQ